MSRPVTPAFSLRRQPLASASNPSSSSAAIVPGSASTSNLIGSRSTTPLARGGSGLGVGPTTGYTNGSSGATVSLEEWERLAPLSDEQVQSVARVKEQFGSRALPDKFIKHDGPSSSVNVNSDFSRPVTPPQPRPKQLSNLLSQPHSPLTTLLTSSSSVPSSAPGSPAPSALGVPHNISDPLRPLPHSIITPQQFHDHFAALTLSTENEQDSLYREHLAEIIGLREKCDGLIQMLRDEEAEVEEMLKCLKYVEERSESLRGACEDLLEEQTHLLTQTSQLAHRLSFFTSLEVAQRMLNNSSTTLVLKEDFLPMVRRLDECIGYLSEHRDFKDADVYLLRYQQCMTRSMALIRLHFINSIKSLGNEVGKRLSDKSMSDTATTGLLFNRFVTLSNQLRPLIAEIEQRVALNTDELPQILADCQAAWVQMRHSLIGPRVAEETARLEPSKSELVELTRAGCSYLKQTCLDEFHLYKHFFNSGEGHLYGFLESLCDYLYDYVRPRILHETSLSVLCEVCTVLQALMVPDFTSDPDDDTILDEDHHASEYFDSPQSTPGLSPSPSGRGGLREDVAADYFGSPSPSRFLGTPNLNFGVGTGVGGDVLAPSSVSISAPRRQSSIMLSRQQSKQTVGRVRKSKRRPLARLHTDHLLKMVLQDAQTRLVFRAEALIQAEVQHYTPKPSDLDYPGKLRATVRGTPLVPRQLAISLDQEDDDEPTFLSLPPNEAQETWYPTLRTTLWILSCLHTYVDSSVFEDLAQEAVSTCRRSLSASSDLIAARKDRSPMDAKLFLVRHLLILKELTAGLDLGRSTKQRDWSGITDFLRSLLENATLLLGYGRGPTVRGAVVSSDAKMDLDRELKHACEDLIAQCTATATEPIKKFIDQCTNYLSSPRHGNVAPLDTRVGSSSGSGGGGDLSSQEWASPTEILKIHEEFKTRIVETFRSWLDQLMLYLQDEETVRVLVPPAHISITDTYRQFHDLVRAEYDFTTAASLMTPSAVMSLLATVDVRHGV